MVLPVTERKSKVYKTKDDTSPFHSWIIDLPDARAKAKITKAITQMEGGNFGDHKSITDGNGLHERRIDYGPGYRIYYITEGDQLIIIFAGGDKSSQQNDIDNAKEYLKDYRKRKVKEPISQIHQSSKTRKKSKKRK